MRPRRLVFSIALVACSHATPGERERALERIPAKALVVAAADGPALSTPTFRQIVDAARPHIPTTLACVADAATTSQAIALGFDPDAGTTIILITRALVANCPALSRLGDRLYVATIGAGTLAPDRAHSVLGDPAWNRARPYLLGEPLAVAAETPSYRAIGVAQPDPLDAWLAIDTLDAAATETRARAFVGTDKLAITRKGTQVTVHADKLDVPTFATILADVLAKVDAVEASPPAAVIACEPPGAVIVSCHDGTHLKLHSLAAFLSGLTSVDAEPVIAGADVIGIRLRGDPAAILHRDDVVLGIDGHRVTDAKQLVALSRTVGDKASLAVRRDGVEVVLDLSE